MASPIHSYLFSPPSSPPVLPADHVLRSPALSSIRSLIPSNTLPRSSIDGAVKARSPLTQQSRFTLDSTYPAFPSRLRERKDVFTLTVEDTSLSASSSRPNSPRITEKILLGSPGHYLNVPTVAQPVPRGMPGLPKPVIRLLWLASLLITSMMLLVYVPGSRLPSLHTASVSRRLAMASDGRAYVDVLDPIKGWQDAKDRDYVPPQIFAGRLDRRVEAARVAPVVRVPTPHPKANRPSPRPLPRSHEILALQSYLLQSSYNVLPADLDTDAPLDANLVLGYAADEIALHELEAERAQDIVVWYGADGSSLHPHDLLTFLESVHGKDRHPTLIPLFTRPDFDKLLPILKRLDFPMQHGAVVMMGNRPYAADLTEMSAMEANGKLANLLGSIGWGEKKAAPKKVWKPNQVKVKRREMTEVERALEVAKKARK